MSNIREVARLSGCSISTVSRYLNSTAVVSKEQSSKIERVIKKLKYKPNVLAQGVLTKKSGKIGLIIPSFTNPFFPEFVLSIDKAAHEKGYSLLIYNNDGELKLEEQSIDHLLRNRVEGLLVARTENPEIYQDLDIPLVAIENLISDDIPLVASNNFEGGKIAFQHLSDIGCKKILVVSGDFLYESIRNRIQSFIDECHLNDKTVDVMMLSKDEMNQPLEFYSERFSNIHEYDGIFSYNDWMSMRMIQHLSLNGHYEKIGKEINIIGYDNISTSDLVSPQLTTISQEISLLGEKSFNVLFDMISNKRVELKNITEVKLVKRKTTRNES